MRLEKFFEKFETLAEMPGAVGKLRELVLQLAVRGELVESQATDGTAKEIFADKAPQEVSARFDVADSWMWVPFSAVGSQRLGKMLDQKGNRGQLKPYLRNTNVQWMRFQLDDIKELRLEDKELDEYRLMPGDLLICEGGEPGRCAIWNDPDREMYFQKAIHRVRPRSGILPEYLAICLQVDAKNGVLSQHFTGATIKHLTGRSLSEYVIPLPPSPEQRRIVAKVDELMALCDHLEAQQQERETRHTALARAALARFAEAPTPANLQLLFHPSYTTTPAELRKAILTLAVRGKLVPQDPSDEPVDHFLGRITAKNMLLQDEDDDSLPSSWRRVRFEDVAVTTGGVTLGRKVSNRKMICLPYLRVANVKRGEIDLEVIKEVSIAEDEIDRYALREDDLLMTEGGDWDKVGRAAIWKGQIPICLHQNHVFRSRMRSAEIPPVWFERYFNSPDGRRYFESASKQTTNLASINMRQVRGCLVPFPPPAEQRRIVAKVDELMALVDALEAQRYASGTIARNLLAAMSSGMASAS